MRRLIYPFIGVLLFLGGLPAPSESSRMSDPEIIAEARQGLSEILDLWRGEFFEELYLRVIPSGKRGRDYFLERMVNSIRKPVCCWEQLQDVKASRVSPDRVTLVARVGLEKDGAGTEFFTKSFDLIRVGGVWKIPMEDILSLTDSYTYRAVPRKILERPLP